MGPRGGSTSGYGRRFPRSPREAGRARCPEGRDRARSRVGRTFQATLTPNSLSGATFPQRLSWLACGIDFSVDVMRTVGHTVAPASGCFHDEPIAPAQIFLIYAG